MIKGEVAVSNTIQAAKKSNFLAGIASYFVNVPEKVASGLSEKMEADIAKALTAQGIRAVVQCVPSLKDEEAQVELSIEIHNALEVIEKKIMEVLSDELQQALTARGVRATIVLGRE